MAPVTDLTLQGTYNTAAAGVAIVSFQPPSGAWAFRLTLTDTITTSYTVNLVDKIPVNFLVGGLMQGNFPTPFVPGTTYYAGIEWSSTLGLSPVWGGNYTEITFTVAANTAGLALEPIIRNAESIPLVISCWPLTDVSGASIHCIGAGYDRTLPITFISQRGVVEFSDVIPGLLYNFQVNVPGLSGIIGNYYAPTPQNTFGTPIVGTTSITLPWTDPAGAAVSASNCFTTCALHDEYYGWVQTPQIVAVGTQTVTFSGLTKGNEYALYCWPLNASGFDGVGDHRISFTAGGAATSANFGINGWFYSPLGN